MRGVLSLALAIAAACSSSNGNKNPDPAINVGGTYQTAVTLVENDCPGQTVEQHPTVVSHEPGSTTVALTHAGSTYSGSLASDGSFSTTPVMQVFGGVSYTISISGQFSVTAIDAMVQVDAALQPPCSFTARWMGPKGGDPNVIP
jgi:hypothetical protein